MECNFTQITFMDTASLEVELIWFSSSSQLREAKLYQALANFFQGAPTLQRHWFKYPFITGVRLIELGIQGETFVSFQANASVGGIPVQFLT